jgi:hypothetical protein
VGFQLNTTLKADAQFLRRVFLALVFLTTVAGGLVAYTAVQAKASQSLDNCALFCG